MSPENKTQRFIKTNSMQILNRIHHPRYERDLGIEGQRKAKPQYNRRINIDDKPLILS